MCSSVPRTRWTSVARVMHDRIGLSICCNNRLVGMREAVDVLLEVVARAARESAVQRHHTLVVDPEILQVACEWLQALDVLAILLDAHTGC